MSRLLMGAATRSRRGLKAASGTAVPGGFETHIGQVLASADDAREIISTGEVILTDPAVNLGKQDVTDVQGLAGLRFTNVQLEQGTPVAYAHLQFVAESGNTPEFVARVRAVAADNTGTFTTAASDISARTLTTAYVDWSIPVWSTNQDNADTISPNLASIVQEVVDRAGWVAGNSIAFVIQAAPSDPSLSRRRPYSYDGDPNSAPRLAVNTTQIAPPPPPPAGDFGDGYDLFGLEGNASFNPASPTLKDGTPITSSMLTYHNAVIAWLLGTNKHEGTDITLIFNTASVPGDSSSWSNAKSRGGQTTMDSLFRVFRLTGDLRILDYLCLAFLKLPNVEVTAWQPNWTALAGSSTYSDCDGAGGPNYPWSPYAKHLSFQYTNATYGTNLTRANDQKMLHILAKFAWAAWVNRNKVSPAGYNYGTVASTIATRVEGMVRERCGPDTGCWVGNYEGVEGVAGSGITNTGSSRFRQTWGKYPFFVVDGSHTAFDGPLVHRYVGLLGMNNVIDIPNPADALVAATEMMTALRARVIPCTDADYGSKLVLKRNYSFTAHPTVWPQNMTYMANHGGSLNELWMTGGYRSIFNMDDMYGLGRATAWGHYDEGAKTGWCYENMMRSVLTCGFNAIYATAEQGAVTNGRRGLANLGIVFDPGGSKMNNIATYCQNVAGGYGNPESATIASAQFLRAALLAVGDVE